MPPWQAPCVPDATTFVVLVTALDVGVALWGVRDPTAGRLAAVGR